MIRKAFRGLVAVAVATILIEAAAGQQIVTRDKVTLPDRDKKDGSTKIYDGRLELRPSGLVLVTTEKTDKASEKVLPLKYVEIVKFRPGDLVGVDRDEMIAQLGLEDGKTLNEFKTAKANYDAMLRKASGAPEATRRHLEYRAALLTTKIANATPEDKWAEQADAARKDWNSFLTGYKKGWEIWPAAKESARLDVELNKYIDAAKMWSRMEKNPELPPDLKMEAGIHEVDALLRAKAYPNASATAAELLKSATGAAKEKLAIYERAAKAAEGGLTAENIKPVVDDIKKKMAASADRTVRAVGYGVIGELYLKAGQPREAMWAFLTVETVHNSDKDEVLKALCRLVDVFKAQADQDEYEKRYREKIRRFRASF